MRLSNQDIVAETALRCVTDNHTGRLAQMHRALDRREARIANLEEIVQRAIGIIQGAAVDAASLSQVVKFPDNIAPTSTIYAEALTLVEQVLQDGAA